MLIVLRDLGWKYEEPWGLDVITDRENVNENRRALGSEYRKKLLFPKPAENVMKREKHPSMLFKKKRVN